MKATEISYTENELKAIEVLRQCKGQNLSAKELGIPTAVLESLIKKANDERPMAAGVDRIHVVKGSKIVPVTVEKEYKTYDLED